MSSGKERILAVERIITSRPKTVKQILECLDKRYGIKAERKAVYDDIAILTIYCDIQHCKKGYYIEKGGAE